MFRAFDLKQVLTKMKEYESKCRSESEHFFLEMEKKETNKKTCAYANAVFTTHGWFARCTLRAPPS
jgi:hypothetical protein